METKKLKIVAVDDDDTILDMYKTGLIQFDVVTFDEPKKAKKYLEELKESEIPDIILMDIMMPHLDGITFIRDIRSSEKLGKIPIVAVSGLSDAATLNDALLFGAVDYVIKPFDITDLASRIIKITSKYPIKR
ncbi:MAG: response regulator [Elusimicrobiales bacterium]|nr:response regulator [Elusimicrobiales bacterium]